MEFDEEERKRFLKETAPLDMFLKLERETKQRAVKLACTSTYMKYEPWLGECAHIICVII